MDKKWRVNTTVDPITGDLVINLPADFLHQVGWDFGDTIEWDVDESGSFAILTKKDSKVLDDGGNLV